MIQIDHVTFSYGEENESAGGVQDINLNIEDGQFIVLCGESGCGKTTTALSLALALSRMGKRTLMWMQNGLRISNVLSVKNGQVGLRSPQGKAGWDCSGRRKDGSKARNLCRGGAV
mgnify:CR=1 FL=1